MEMAAEVHEQRDPEAFSALLPRHVSTAGVKAAA